MIITGMRRSGMTLDQYQRLITDVIEARVKRGWTCRTLAKESMLSEKTVYMLENGAALSPGGWMPERDTVCKLCTVLGLNHGDYLWG